MPIRFDSSDLFQWPFSGNVTQRITTPWFSPALTFNIAGDAAVEEKVVRDVASYGTQLGLLNEIVEGLLIGKQPDDKVLKKFRQLLEDVREVKEKKKRSTLDTAVEALNDLRQESPNDYAKLLESRAATDRRAHGRSLP